MTKHLTSEFPRASIHSTSGNWFEKASKRVIRSALAGPASFPLNVGHPAYIVLGCKCGRIDAIMKTNNSITAAVFSAFLKCHTKAHLLAIGEPAACTFFTDIEARISSMYKAVAGSGVSRPS
jgi:hypothetical protein